MTTALFQRRADGKPDLAQVLLREGDEARTRFLQGIELGTDPIVLAQDLGSAAECYAEAAKEIALRARKGARRG